VKILLTRPEPGASATAARLAAMGHVPMLAPCLAIVPRAASLPESAAVLIITSGQAIPALAPSLHNRPVFCVGDATAAKLRAAGFTRVESASGTAEDLAKLILARRLPGLHVMAVGERHGLALARRLRAAGVAIIRRKVYIARPTRALPDDVVAALAAGEIDAALFYSAETASAFARLRPPGTAAITALALSETVAAALAVLPWRAIRVALGPTEADLMALMA